MWLKGIEQKEEGGKTGRRQLSWAPVGHRKRFGFYSSYMWKVLECVKPGNDRIWFTF